MDHATLQWVQGDIEDTLTQARAALEKFSEDSHSSHYVQSCADSLHSVHGVLEMLEYYGACLLLEEMESLCRMLQSAEVDDANEEMCELLLRSILHLGEYLNYLRAGHQDTPTIFMPLLNDLRCVRGEPLLSENALFAPDLNVDIPSPAKTHDLDEAQLCEIARRLRAYYQKGLLDWYQGTVDETGLSLMQAVVARCEKLCGGTPSVRLWWIAAGVIEALRNGGLDASVSVRRLLGLLDQQLKTISRDGSAALARAAPADLVKNLLYYLAHANSSSARVQSIRAAYRLDELFIGEDATERAERILCGPDLESLKVVAAGIKEDLASVKMALDSHVRKGGQGGAAGIDSDNLAPVGDKLRRVADTLGLLNLGRSRKLVAAHVEQLRSLAQSPDALSESVLMGIARDLLRVDSTLDNIAEHGLAAGEQPLVEPVTVGSGDTELNSIEYLRLVTAVVGEATTELAAIKHIIGEHLREPRDATLLAEISRHVSVVEGSLRMLSLERAADLLRDWGRCASSLLSGAERAPLPESLDALADALVGLEYYLESVVGLQPNDHALLEFTEDCIRSLERTTAQIRDDRAISVVETTPAPAPTPAPALESEIDDDIIAVFIDEAREVIQTLQDCLMRWNADPRDREALITARRSFHTLKGSGRLVGAHDVGEYAWVVENLLNRVIEGICPITRAILQFVTEAHARLPAMVDALTAREPVGLDLEAFAERARELLTQHPGVSAKDTTTQFAVYAAGEAEQGQVSVDMQGGSGESEDMRRIFVGEAERILELSEAIVEHWRESTYDPRFVTELQRELHTLKGGARTVGLTAVGDLSHALESVLMMVAEEHLPPSESLLDLIEDCHDRLEELLRTSRDKHASASVEDLITRMDDLVCPGVSGASAAEGMQLGDTETSITSGLAEVTRGGAVVARQSAAGNGRLIALDKGERIQVSSTFLDSLSDYAGELTISHSRFGQQVGAFKYNLEEMDQTITRLRDQLRRLEIETEAQVQSRKDQAVESDSKQALDGLALERFSKLQQLSRSLLESVSDLRSIRDILGGIARESDDMLAEQARVSKDLQQGLMRTRLLPFSEQAQRFRRLVRRTMTELDKRVELEIEGEDIRLDRTILERITPSLEHVLRNAVDHGIEPPEKRKQLGKREIGTVKIGVSRSGPEVVIKISDDGTGLDQNAIYRVAVQKKMVASGAKLTDEELFQLILEPGFSTMQTVTQISGRGVGLDVVNADIKQFGGTLDIASHPGQGCVFTIRLPFTLAVNQALLVVVDNEHFALPISNVAGVVRVSGENLRRLETEQSPSFEYAGSRYPFAHLGTMLEFGEPSYDESRQPNPVVLVHAGEHRMAFLVENLIGRHEIVVKSLGPQLSAIQWLSGATVLGDGRVAMILDVPALLRRAASLQGVAHGPSSFGQQAAPAENAATVMVVDDSITVRQVTQRLLNRNGIEVFTAKDGIEALALLKERRPDLMLLDIEMPRMDGFELAATIRKDNALKDLPIIMITSRTGKKHSDHAAQLGVNRYLGKPYHEGELLENINVLLGRS